MPESAYIETTIPSLYVAKPSGQLVEAARQRLTKIWWDMHRRAYDLVCSQTVLDECGRGESEMAAKRLALLDSIPLLDLSPEVLTISQDLIDRDIIPMKAADDAVHIAVAAVHGIDYLLTWNCKHIANPRNRRRISDCLSAHGYRSSVICTPEELIGDDN
jgi:predicted nucleic acid-binding protein